MKPLLRNLLCVLIGLPMAGCLSSETPQASPELKQQFAGGPMPPDAQKQFQESMAKSHTMAQQRAQGGGAK